MDTWTEPYCVRVMSSEDETLCGGRDGTKFSAWDGDPLELLQNGVVVGTFEQEFNNREICIDQVDQSNDVFELRSTGNDGVSFLAYDTPHIRIGVRIQFRFFEPPHT